VVEVDQSVGGMHAASSSQEERDLDLEDLFTPFAVGHLQLRNRFVMPGMQRGHCEEGAPTREMIEYYRRRAAGGVGLIVGEGCCVEHPSSFCEARFPRLNLRTCDGWGRCIEAVHSEGGKMLIQISHLGAMRANSPNIPKLAGPALSPSGLFSTDKVNGRAATEQELAEILETFVDSARLAKAAGADGIELHGCHGFLLDEFLWASTNKREDRYGGDTLQARCRYPAEIVSAIRREVGPHSAISFRFSQWKEPDYTARIAETPTELGAFLNAMQVAGVDVFHPSTRRFTTPEFPGSPLGLAGWTKSLVQAPVIAVGSVGLTEDVMESLVGNAEAKFGGVASLRELATRFANGEFDLIAIGRSLISDAEWVRKVRDHRFDDIRVFSKRDLGELLEVSRD
jgi:2,4-dienoyl-CoA reductase-like NADH-dependent reductase (Old Yellow Enzyme family)